MMVEVFPRFHSMRYVVTISNGTRSDGFGVVEIDGSSDGIMRINIQDTITFKLCRNATDGIFLIDAMGAAVAELKARGEAGSHMSTVDWKPFRPGPITIRVKPFSSGHELKLFQSSFSPVESTIVVDPVKFDLRRFRMLTVMPRRLGTISSWPTVLGRLVTSMEYNAVHFTPCQPSGPSHSSYSISDVLDVDPVLFPTERSDSGFRWVALKEALAQLPSVAKVTDVVLNHASSSDSWVVTVPEALYSLHSCSYLTGAADLDNQLHRLSTENPQYLGINSEDTLRICMHSIRVVLEKFAFIEYFQLDMRGSVDLWSSSESEPKQTIPALWQAFQQAGTGRGYKIVVDLRHECQDITSVWRELYKIQDALTHAAKDCFESAFRACESTLRYERLVSGKLDGPLLPKYFTRLPSGDWAANNGWVMNWPAGVDFAAPGHHLVFMRRHVVAWGDCLKLRYDTTYTSPVWTVMEEYCRRIAGTFDGIRLDNCHSTPIHVLRRLITVMRESNPDLVVIAELFTGEAGNDQQYEASIGIDLLVKEAMQISSVDELMGKVWRCANQGLADIGTDSDFLRTTRASAIIYDATHDNSTCYTRFGSIKDALPLAAAVAAAPAAMGSSVGFDSLRTRMPSVVTTEVRTMVDDFPPDSDRNLAIWLPGYEEARQVTVYGDWNEWEEEIELQRSKAGWVLPENVARTLHLIPGKTQYKFFVNRVGWTCNKSVGLAAGKYNNNLYGTGGQFASVKRQLMQLHEICNTRYNQFFAAVKRGGLLEIKRYNDLCEGYVFLIRFGGPVLGCGVSTESLVDTIPLESEISSIALAVSLSSSNGDEVDSLLLSHFEEQAVYWSEADLGLTKTDEGYSLSVPPYGVVVLKMNPLSQLKSMKAIPSPPINDLIHPRDFSYILFSCEAEEPVYDVPGMGKILFAGLAGIANTIEQVFHNDSAQFLASPLAENIRQGDWLFDFIVSRLELRFPLLHKWATETVKPIYTLIPTGLKPKWFVYIFREKLYGTIMREWSSRFALNVDEGLEKQLRIASFQFTVEQSVAAGLPHFASGYMRCWGRDTFISFPGLFLAVGRYAEARDCILSFARVVRHGLIPNLYDDGFTPRYNARDACWCFLNAVRLYIEKTKDVSILDSVVEVKFFDRAFSPKWRTLTDRKAKLVDIVVGILMSHYRGIDFVEENAGPQIDEHMTDRGFRICVRVNEDGFVVGGNEWNCGTWMDKMGSKEGKNRGYPATSRYGANIEINALALAVLKFFTQFSLDKSVKTDLVNWLTNLSGNWDGAFWNGRLGRYNDTILGDPKGDKLRPNGLYALSQIPVEAVDKTHAVQYIQQCEESLLGPLGMRTLPATDPDYNGWYDNSDESGGYNYHNGPEWVWLLGHFVIAAKKFSVLDDVQLSQILGRHYQHVMKSSIVWKSLPELTNTNGAFCSHSCPSQAWSVCCLLEAIECLKTNGKH